MPHLLYLNPMRGRSEALSPVAKAATKELLEQFVASELVEPYTDTGERTVFHDTDSVAQEAGGPVREKVQGYQYQKTFRAGGPLEWYNKPDGRPGHYVEVPERDAYIEQQKELAGQHAARVYDAEVVPLPTVG